MELYALKEFFSNLVILVLIAVTSGLIIAVIAYFKGRSFWSWWILGTIGSPLGLLLVLILLFLPSINEAKK